MIDLKISINERELQEMILNHAGFNKQQYAITSFNTRFQGKEKRLMISLRKKLTIENQRGNLGDK